MIDRNRNACQTGARRWTFRILALSLPFVLLGLLELACRIAGWGLTDPLLDPLLQSAQTPVFELSPDGTHLHTRTDKLRIFAHQTFPSTKPPDEVRIFCIGGSTVQGRPYSSPTAFPAWLQITLDASHPERRWKIVNVGGISYGTERLLPVLDECLTYSPDLIVLCTGHNEFLERHAYDHLPAAARSPARLLRHLQLYKALEQQLRASPPASPPPAEVDTLLDHRGGLDRYRHEPEWRRHVASQFGSNLRSLIRLATGANVPLVVVAPPSNLKDCPPFKSGFTQPLSEQQKAGWQEAIDSANTHTQTDPARSLAYLESALAIDENHALTHYLLGRTHLARNSREPARDHLRLARDNDLCPLRMPSELQRSLQKIATETGTPLFDADALLSAQSPLGIVGTQLLVDHVHPSIKGHQQIAKHLAPYVLDALELDSEPSNPPDLAERYQAHIDSLPPLYFTHGLRRLRAVQAWTEGRVDEPQPARETLPAETE